MCEQIYRLYFQDIALHFECETTSLLMLNYVTFHVKLRHFQCETTSVRYFM